MQCGLSMMEQPGTRWDFLLTYFCFLIFKCDDRACLDMPLCGPVIQSQIKIVAKNNDPTELLSDDLQSPADLNI